jgi:hypothetical protein
MKPIIFSTPMVKAILDGKKSVTRRVIKPQPRYQLIYREGQGWNEYSENPVADPAVLSPWGYGYKCPWQIGQILWVRETWAHYDAFYPNATWKNCHVEGKGWTWVDYKATATHKEVQEMADVGGRWKPSIHMPRWAARLFLTVKDVRVERLQDITEEDAMAEGVDWLDDACYSNNGWSPTYNDPDSGGRPILRDGFEALWDKINSKRNGGQYAWDKSPWVWVISFEVCKGERVKE